MVMRHFGWTVLVLTGVLACVLTGQRVAETRREIGLLQRKIGLATIEEVALQRQLVQDRHDRAIGLLAPLRRPLMLELPMIVQRIPTNVRVQEMIITPQEWHVIGRQAPTTENESMTDFTLRLTRGDAGRSP
jgi:hypothetical protein